jgi:hypothetical protein
MHQKKKEKRISIRDEFCDEYFLLFDAEKRWFFEHHFFFFFLPRTRMDASKEYY